jgi:hypothetical protein
MKRQIDWQAIMNNKKAMVARNMVLGQITGLCEDHNKQHVVVNAGTYRYHIPKIYAKSHDNIAIMFKVPKNNVTQFREKLG